MQSSINFLISIKSGNLENFTTAYNFTTALLKRPSLVVNMIFFYQDGCNILLDTAIHHRWILLLAHNQLHAAVCTSSCKKRGIKLVSPFKPGSMMEFIDTSQITNKVIQF